MDAFYEATTRLLEDITSFNKGYTTDLDDKSKGDAKVFVKVEEFLIETKAMPSTKSTISQDSTSQMVSNIDSIIKVELDPIRSIDLQLPTNAPHVVHDRKGDKKGKVVRQMI